MTGTVTFNGYGVSEPLQRDVRETYPKSMTFEPRPLEDDEVEIRVSACGMYVVGSLLDRILS